MGGDEVLGAPEFRPFPNLKGLTFTSHDNPLQTVISGGASTILQGLLNSAPNLEEVNMTIDFYPDFTSCKNLRILTFNCIGLHKITLSDPSAISRMMDTCSNSVVRLTLSGFYKTLSLAQVFANV